MIGVLLLLVVALTHMSQPTYLADSEIGQWKKFELSSPLTAQQGDLFELEGQKVYLVRSGVRIDQRILVNGQPHQPAAVEQAITVTDLVVRVLPKERHMLSVTVASVEYQPAGTVFINFTDGTQLEFTDRAALLAFGAEIETSAEWAQKAIVRAWLHRSPDGGNPAWINGKTFQFDLSLDLGQLQIGVIE